jgi:two-component system sensor histidine kinase KdpD
MASSFHRKTPDEILREVEASELPFREARLKIFLGYASGVGKTFRMLDEARRRRERGQDVVVGGMQPRVPLEVAAILHKLEVIPLRRVAGGAAIDVETIVSRSPAVCFIDGLAYDNPPGTRNPTRWQDVQDLLNAGIQVVGSVNIQFIAELREQVESITGKRVTETVPVSFVESADEIEIVDAPALDLLGSTAEEAVDLARRQRQLATLRELALVTAADVVDRQLERYLKEHGISQRLRTQERLMVCITPRSNTGAMLDAARLMADSFHAELIVAYVHQPDISEADRAALEERLETARGSGATVEILKGSDPVSAILDFAHSRGMTQLFIGHSQRTGIGPWLLGNPVEKIIQRSHGMDVHIFPQ